MELFLIWSRAPRHIRNQPGATITLKFDTFIFSLSFNILPDLRGLRKLNWCICIMDKEETAGGTNFLVGGEI